MANAKGETAGELASQASRDSEKYDVRELSFEWTKSITEEVWKCVDNHKGICEDDEFCVVMVYADDSILANVKRRKFYGYPHLPKPRPRQSCWLYRKDSDDIEFLWALPEAGTMATLGTILTFDKRYAKMATWCRAFFDGTFHELIRQQTGITTLSEDEFLHAHAEETVKPVGDDRSTALADTFDFFKPFKSQVIDPSKPLLN